MFMNPIFPENSGATLLFERSPSRASEIDYFEIFSRPRENQLAQRFVLVIQCLLLVPEFSFKYIDLSVILC